MNNEEALKILTFFGDFSYCIIKVIVYVSTADGVVTFGEVVGGIFFCGDELFGVEELSVGSGSDLIDGVGFEIEESTSRDVIAILALRKYFLKSIIFDMLC